MRLPWLKHVTSEPDVVPVLTDSCLLDDGTLIDVPVTSFIKKRMPLLVIEQTHYHVLRDGENPTWMHFRNDGLTNFDSLPVGVYTVEHYMDLDEFFKENKP